VSETAVVESWKILATPVPTVPNPRSPTLYVTVLIYLDFSSITIIPIVVFFGTLGHLTLSALKRLRFLNSLLLSFRGIVKVPLHIQNNYLKGAAIMLTFICFLLSESITKSVRYALQSAIISSFCVASL
jgi:hypothetical protein